MKLLKYEINDKCYDQVYTCVRRSARLQARQKVLIKVVNQVEDDTWNNVKDQLDSRI